MRSTRALDAEALEPMRRRLARVDGVGSVSAAVLTADRRGARIDLALDVDSTSPRGMEIARGPLRDAAHATAPAGSDRAGRRATPRSSPTSATRSPTTSS